MKAIVYSKENSASQLVLQEVERPDIKSDQVLIKVNAVSINAADYRSMQMGIIPQRKIFGSDVAGVITEVGSLGKHFTVGDEVLGDLSSAGFGGFAEYVAAPEGLLVEKPADVSFVDAAAIPMASITALQGLRDLGQIQAGQDVLIYGAGGGVGLFAVQLARYFGARVTAVCGSGNVELVRSLGAEQVIDYSTEDVFASGLHFDLVLAVNGKQNLAEYKSVLKPKGRMVLVGGALSQIAAVVLFGWFYSLAGKHFKLLSAKASTDDLAFVVRLVQEGKISVILDSTYPLERTAEAIDHLRQGHVHGKVVIQV